MSIQVIQNYISGSWISSENQETLEKMNPFTGELLNRLSSSDAMDAIKAIQAAKKAQLVFEKIDLSQRAQYLSKMGEYLETHRAEIALQEATEQGLSYDFVLTSCVDHSVENLRQAAKTCIETVSQTVNFHGQATGVVAIITSWCLSLKLISERLAPALAAGNVVIIKCSELSPGTAKHIAAAVEFAGLPVGVVQILQGQGTQVGSTLAAHPAIRALSFAGKISHMENLIKTTSAQMKKVQLSSGAKNSSFILSDANWKENFSSIMFTALSGQGQLCWNTHRFFISENIQNDFYAELDNYLNTLKPSNGPQDKSIWTPLISKQSAERVQQSSVEAVQEHAQLTKKQAQDAQGFFAPIVFTKNLTNCSVLQQDEVPGSLFVVTAVKYQHEMSKWSNTGYFGHSAVIWGSSEKALKFAETLQCGQVWTNGWLKNSSPVVGHKQSFYGNPDFRPFGSFYSDVKSVI